jgi:hypothetical protein
MLSVREGLAASLNALIDRTRGLRSIRPTSARTCVVLLHVDSRQLRQLLLARGRGSAGGGGGGGGEEEDGGMDGELIASLVRAARSFDPPPDRFELIVRSSTSGSGSGSGSSSGEAGSARACEGALQARVGRASLRPPQPRSQSQRHALAGADRTVGGKAPQQHPSLSVCNTQQLVDSLSHSLRAAFPTAAIATVAPRGPDYELAMSARAPMLLVGLGGTAAMMAAVANRGQVRTPACTFVAAAEAARRVCQPTSEPITPSWHTYRHPLCPRRCK